jgi:hypothetical protein
MTFHWSAEAVITETVPRGRTSPRWIAKRSLRIGAINYRVRYKAAGSIAARTRVVGQMLGRLPLSLVRTARLLPTSKVIVAMHPMLVAFGSALAALGIEQRPYEASKIAS